MARTWRKGFVLFLTILTLTTLGRSIIPGNELGTTCMVNCPPKSEWPEAENTNRQNISLSHQSLMHSIQSQNQKGDWSQVNQTTTYLKSIRCPTPLQPHNPIIVGSDADFAIQGWPGNGTQENPYSIRDLNITGDDDCIQIGNTSVHFVVENCWLGLGDWGRSGITIDNVTHGLIANTTSVNRVFGIRMTFSESIEFFNNTCINTSYGISVSDSNAIKIFNNTCSNSNFGLLIFDSSSTEIINNTIRNCEYFGCEIYPVNNNILVNNSLVNCGFLFGSWNYLFGSPRSVGVGSIVDVEAQISGNSVNQRPLILWLGRIGLTVPLGGGQVILLNCTSIIVQDQNLTNATIGVFLCFTRQSQVFNNTLTGHSANGIRIQNCEDITLSNNLCNNNSISGITLDQTVNTSLTENRCNYNSGGSGIHLDETYDNQLLNNTCLHNLTGIRLQSAYGTELLNNTCNQNRSDWGLWGFEYRGVGILISGNTNVARENFCNDNYIGIGIWGQENHVGENTCTNNTIGIFLNGDSTPIANNLCVNDIIGIYIYRYLETIIIDNSMVGCGLYIVYQGSEWTADVLIHGNRVNGRPLIFYKNQMNRQVPLGAGQIILFNCQRIIVRGQTLTGCSDGILVYCTNDSIFANNVLGDKTRNGIQAFDSHNNHYTLNIFTNNEAVGLYLRWDCLNNIVDWNFFLCNASHDARDYGPEFQNPDANIFDCNFWANYSGYDLNFNGFGDIPYNVSGNADNCDLHPLMNPTIVLVKRTVEQLLPLLESVAILVVVIIVFVLVRAKLKYSSPTSPNNLRSTLT